MIRAIFCLVTLAAMFMLAAPLRASHGCAGTHGCGCHVQCPECHHFCKLTVDKEKVAHHCWEVECKPVCVPRVHFPWECGCPPKCAKVIYVNVLKKEEYECEQCRYTWTPELAECRSGCATECSSTSCDVLPYPAEEPQPAPEPARSTTSQRLNWFDSAKTQAVRTAKALPVRFQRAVENRETH
jgi:hypothetical protein